MIHKEEHELTDIKNLTTAGKIRYLNVHSERSKLRKVTTKFSRHQRGKPYYNYLIRLPKQWADGLELEPHDNFEWSIVSYDPVILQLKKVEGDSA